MKLLTIIIATLLSISVYANDDITFKMTDTNLGVYNDDYNTKNDLNKFSIMFTHGTNVKSIGSLYSIEAHYGYKIDEIWLQAFYAQTIGGHHAIFGDQENTIDATDLQDTTQKVMTGGLGLGYRFTYLKELFNSNKWYESTTAFMTYSMMNEAYSGEAFNGFGVRTDFGLHYRMSASNEIGLIGIYSISSMVRGPLDATETRKDRTLTIAGLSCAFQYGIYF